MYCLTASPALSREFLAPAPDGIQSNAQMAEKKRLYVLRVPCARLIVGLSLSLSLSLSSLSLSRSFLPRPCLLLSVGLISDLALEREISRLASGSPFKQYIARCQFDTDYYYRAYPHATTNDVKAAHRVREP